MLPYHKNFLDVLRPLKILGIDVAFTYDNTIKSQLIRNRSSNTPGSVYEVPCQICDSKYIGETGKKLPVRIKRHQYEVKNMFKSNSIFVHKFQKDHHINWEGARNLVFKVPWSERSVLESCLISTSYENNMNTAYGRFKCDPIINRIVCNNIK